MQSKNQNIKENFQSACQFIKTYMLHKERIFEKKEKETGIKKKLKKEKRRKNKIILDQF